MFFTEGKNEFIRVIETILEEYDLCTQKKKEKKNYFNNNLVMALEDEQGFQSSNRCWICDKLSNVGNNKVRDHCHINSKET